MHRRSTSRLALLIALPALLVAACGSDDDTDAGPTTTEGASSDTTEIDMSRFEGMTLTIAGFSPEVNAIAGEGVDARFEELTGAKIEWLGGSAADNYTKLLAAQGGEPPYDVGFFDTLTQTRAVEAGLIQEQDPSKIAGSDQLPPEAYPQPGYGSAFWLVRMSSCVNVAEFEAAGVPVPDSVEVWFDPVLDDRIALADTANVWWSTGIPALADHYGVPYDDPSGLIDRFKEIEAKSFFSSSGDAQALLQSGEVWLVPLADGRCYGSKLSGEPIDFVPLNLEIDGETYSHLILHDTWEIPVGVDELTKELAYIFMGLQLDAEGSLPAAEKLGFLPARTDVLAEAAAMPSWQEYDVVGDFDISKAYSPNYSEFIPHMDAWIAAWNEAFKS